MAKDLPDVNEKQLIRIFRDWNDPTEFDEKGRLYLPCPLKDWDFKPIVPKYEMHALVGSGPTEDGEFSLECVIERDFGIWRARPIDQEKARVWVEESERHAKIGRWQKSTKARQAWKVVICGRGSNTDLDVPLESLCGLFEIRQSRMTQDRFPRRAPNQ